MIEIYREGFEFDWSDIGTLSEPMIITPTSLEAFEGWANEVRRAEFTVKLSASQPAIRRMFGAEHGPRVPVFWPRMKNRAARRRAGYTRTGRRRRCRDTRTSGGR